MKANFKNIILLLVVVVAIVLGAASGLSATGTNQAVKQLTGKTDKTE